jgi:hypothetical protein
MKKFFYTMVFALITSLAISACSEEPILPADTGSTDPCQFGGPNCPK